MSPHSGESRQPSVPPSFVCDSVCPFQSSSTVRPGRALNYSWDKRWLRLEMSDTKSIREPWQMNPPCGHPWCQRQGCGGPALAQGPLLGPLHLIFEGSVSARQLRPHYFFIFLLPERSPEKVDTKPEKYSAIGVKIHIKMKEKKAIGEIVWKYLPKLHLNELQFI